MSSSETLPSVVDQGTDVAHIDRELDANVASSVNSGVWTREEAQRHYGYSEKDMDRALVPPMSLLMVQRELGEIDRLRRTDKRAYYANEKIQQDERRLITLRHRGLRNRALAGRKGRRRQGLKSYWNTKGFCGHASHAKFL